MKGRNISLPRCAPLPRTVSKFWKRKRKCCLVFPSSTKREALSRHSRATTAKKCTKKACVQSCCFKNLNVLLFFHSRCHGRRRVLSSLIIKRSTYISAHAHWQPLVKYLTPLSPQPCFCSSYWPSKISFQQTTVSKSLVTCLYLPGQLIYSAFL